MERLTEWVGSGPERKAIARQDRRDIGDKDCVTRLAAYEDTGLTPERVAELAEAEQAGRLVVLPCKVGDVAYFPVEGRWDSATIEHIEVWSSGVRFFWVQYDVGPETNELWDDGDFEMKDIGKTVFLTRQEAEAAAEAAKTTKEEI